MSSAEADKPAEALHSSSQNNTAEAEVVKTAKQLKNEAKKQAKLDKFAKKQQQQGQQASEVTKRYPLMWRLINYKTQLTAHPRPR